MRRAVNGRFQIAWLRVYLIMGEGQFQNLLLPAGTSTTHYFCRDIVLLRARSNYTLMQRLFRGPSYKSYVDPQGAISLKALQPLHYRDPYISSRCIAVPLLGKPGIYHVYSAKIRKPSIYIYIYIYIYVYIYSIYIYSIYIYIYKYNMLRFESFRSLRPGCLQSWENRASRASHGCNAWLTLYCIAVKYGALLY